MPATRSNDPEGGPPDSVVRGMQQDYADALLAGNEPGAEQVVREAIEAGLSETTISDDVIAPAMRLVGHMWEAGLISVADEHHATEITIRVLALQREAFRVARGRAAQRVLLAAVQGERHVVGLSMAASAIVHAGYDVRLLGADLPTEALAHATERHRPVIVGLTATMPGSAAVVPEVIRVLRELDPGIGVVIGGAAASPQLAGAPGVAICQHVGEAVAIVDGLLQRAAHN